MELNDHASDADRQRLLPFVTRLDCADTPKIERQREDFILRYTGDCGRLPFSVGLEALEGALAIGRQADPLGPGEVQIRMGATRSGQNKPRWAIDPVSAPGKPFISKVKSWLTSKELEPAA